MNQEEKIKIAQLALYELEQLYTENNRKESDTISKLKDNTKEKIELEAKLFNQTIMSSFYEKEIESRKLILDKAIEAHESGG